jgi:hypothetical protein
MREIEVAEDETTDHRRNWTMGGRVWAHIKAMVPTVLIFLVAGPLVGYFAIMLPIAVTAIDGPFGVLEGLLGAIAMLPFGALFAYMLGYLPALLTGLAVAAADCVIDLGAYRTPMAIVAGSCVTLLLLLNVSDVENPLATGVSGFGSAAAAVGAIAAGVCAMIAPRRVPVRSLAHTRQAGVGC